MGERRTDPIEAHLDTIFTVARSTARALGTNRYEADEVAQLTAYKLWRRWEDPKLAAIRALGGPRWSGYIRRVASNTHFDLIRQHQRRLARQRKAEEHRRGRPIADGDAELPWLAVGDIEAWVARQAIAQEILLLPAQQQKVAARIFLLEMSVRQVADELGLQDQTVRKHARLARATLRERLSDPRTEPQPL